LKLHGDICTALAQWAQQYFVWARRVLYSISFLYHVNVSLFQINFFKDHTKIIFDPLLGGVTYIDEQRKPRTYSLELIEKYGCSAELASRLIYALDKVKLIEWNVTCQCYITSI
jgi:hypothetical protein